MDEYIDPHRFHLFNNVGAVSKEHQWCITSQQGDNVILCVGGEIVRSGNIQRAFQTYGTTGAYYFLCKDDAQAELDTYLAGLREEADKVYVNI